ncbi:phytoene/squalene synthase family protein [Leuconostoc koreense]|nr:phytoene/squalene synthase family protein [Leuconostoc mesenteroides]QGM25740.1 phytoene/squalene synthase family protein [Leuconostoc mesenteroides subsp. mesenteroides]
MGTISKIPPKVLENFSSSKAVIKQNSSSFYFAFSKLDKDQAYSIFVIYDYLRQIDDAADNHDRLTFNKLISYWKKACDNKDIVINKKSNIADKVAYVFNHFSIDYELMTDMIQGQLHDLNNIEINTLAELENYCYQVAGTVGCMIFCILSTESIEDNREAVINVGIALQLTNILRDIHEDAMANKYFIPNHLISQYNVPKKNFLEDKSTLQTQDLLMYLANLALSKYDQTDYITNQISNKKNKIALKLSIVVYKQILIKLIKNGFVDLSKRIYVTRQEKLLILLKTVLTT